MENKKKITIKSAIACLVLLVILIGASFAYFGMFTVNLENKVAVNIYANDIGNTSFIATSANLNVIVPKSGMFKGNTGLAAENTATLTVNLTGAPNVTTTCTYDVVYEYNLDSEIYGNTVNVTSGATKEITMQVESPSGTNSYVNETNFAYDSSWTPKTSTVGAKKILVKGATIKSSGTSTIQDINITGRYYNLNLDKSQLVDKSFTGTIYVENNNCTVKELEPTLYNAIAKRYNNGDEQVKLYDGTKYGDTTTYANNIYYFDVYTTNNNVLFGGFCWQMVRTTETGGVKMLYNGVQKDFYSSESLSQSEYSNLNNDASYPYTYDETNKTWTSTNTGTNSSTISFSAPSNGNYVINYDLSMYNYINYINVEIFKDDVSQGKFTGTTNGQIVFKGLTTTNVIKIIFTRKSSSTSGSRNNVIFSFGKVNNIIKTCNNTGTDTTIGTSAFNSHYDSPAHVGYMYNKNKAYASLKKSMTSLSNIAFGNSFTYENGNYILKDTITVSTWSNEYENINNNHYTFFNESTSQSKIYYVYYTTSSEAYYIELSNGKSVEDALNDMLYGDNVNVDNSTIKDTIDTWYTNNMTSYTDKLEDTVFCYDRSMVNKSSNGWNPNGGSTTTTLKFKSYSTKYGLMCENKNDRFTVSSSNGNGALTYPVGLLSYVEIYKFPNGQNVWFGTAVEYGRNASFGGAIGATYGTIVTADVSASGAGVRPAISLKPGTEISSGDGSYTNPFVIE